MSLNRMYDEFAHLWPLISDPADYAEEARHWRDAIQARLGPGKHRILDLGVGGGHNLSHLTADFEATAVDASEPMLANSIRLNPEVTHHVGDMRSVRLGTTFHAVLIHDAVDYLLNEGDLRATLETARAHLGPGGLLLMAPDWVRETFTPSSHLHRPRRQEDLELTFVEFTYDPDPEDTTIETLFVYFLREGGQLRVEQDRHVSGLFPLATWLSLMEAAGFAAETVPYPVHEDGREAVLLVGALRE